MHERLPFARNRVRYLAQLEPPLLVEDDGPHAVTGRLTAR
jgi:hypothetical protein